MRRWTNIERQMERRGEGGRLSCAIGLMALAVGFTCCHRSAPPQPGDPMVEAIRAEEREAGFTYAEGQGRQLFRQYCSTCHGDDAKGDGQNASMITPAPVDFTGLTRLQDVAYLRKAIVEGSAAVGRSPLSPPWGRSLRPQEIEDLVAYCHFVASQKASTK